MTNCLLYWNALCDAYFCLLTFFLVTQGIFIFSLVTYEPLTYNKTYHYPRWAQALGWLMALSSIMCIPLVAIIKFLLAEGTFYEVHCGIKGELYPKIELFLSRS